MHEEEKSQYYGAYVTLDLRAQMNRSRACFLLRNIIQWKHEAGQTLPASTNRTQRTRQQTCRIQRQVGCCARQKSILKIATGSDNENAALLISKTGMP
jgi:hypothetical protein